MLIGLLALLSLLALGPRGDLPSTAIPTSDVGTGTWSIVAVHETSHEVGVALATCLAAELTIARVRARAGGRPAYAIAGSLPGGPGFELTRIIPGVGAMVAQGLVGPGNAARLDRGSRLMMEGATPGQVIAGLTGGDLLFQQRQYGVAAVTPATGHFTGADAPEWAGAAKARTAAAQGNFLVGPDVVDDTLTAFAEAAASPDAGFREALVAALQAGADRGGDRRCGEQTALIAFVAVASPDDVGDEPGLWLAVPPRTSGGENPVTLLRQALDDPAGRAELLGDGEGGSRRWVVVLAVAAGALVLLAAAVLLARRRASFE